MPQPLYPQERTPVPNEEEVGWAPETVWMVFGEEKISGSCQDSNPRISSL